MKKATKNHAYLLLLQCIRNLRQERNYTEQSVADALNITQPAYGQKENGVVHFKVEELFRIAAHFQICIMELFADHVTEPEFADYAASRGYVYGESCLREIKMLRQQVNTLHTEHRELEKVITNLEKDKKFLRDILKGIDNNERLTGRGVSSLSQKGHQ